MTEEETTTQQEPAAAEAGATVDPPPHHHRADARKSSIIISASILLGALLISASVFYSATQLIKIIPTALTAAVPAVNPAPAAAAGQAAAPTPASGPVTVTPRTGEATLGNKNAKVTIVEFGDFQCPFCKEFYQQTFNDLKTKYVDTGEVQYIFRDFPLTQIHVNAQIAAEAAECANLQGRFWDYHDLLYTNGQSDGTDLDKASLEKYAAQLKLDSAKFNQCLESNATLPTVNQDVAEGTKDGVTGTPTFFINGQMVVGAQPTATFEQAIEADLK